MAVEWFPVRNRLRDEPEVIAIAAATQRSREEVVGFLCALWGWSSEVTTNGRIPSASDADALRAICAACGGDDVLWRAVCDAKWLKISEGISIPRFMRWLSRGAKRRLQEARRKSMSRGKWPSAQE